MANELEQGIYEDLITRAVREKIESRQNEKWQIQVDDIDKDARCEILAHHFYKLLRQALTQIQGKDKDSIPEQIKLINHLIEVLLGRGLTSQDTVDESLQLLLEAVKPNGPLSHSGPIVRPTLSLRRTGLLVNGRGDVQLGNEIPKEIQSADQIDLLCAFVRYSGLRLFVHELEQRIQNGAKVRVISTVYTGSTEQKAIDKLNKIGADVKISYDISRTRLHAKAWLFKRNSGFHTAYIGSSNLTHQAQIDGLEWNVKVSAIDNPEVIEHFQTAFEQYWNEPEFETYLPERDSKRLQKALSPNSGPRSRIELLIDVDPKPHQCDALEAIEAEREHGHFRNLVISATGTGKTWIAAFDFKRLFDQGKVKSLLFVAHREEILRQSQLVFQLILKKQDFGELLVGGERPQEGRFVFASIQSLASHIGDIAPNSFDVLIVDEFHHAAAPSYDRLLTHLKPKFLLGLTATPERADGKSILEWFDQRIAFENRLWESLDLGLLCPFHYFGVNDSNTDLSQVLFKRGRYIQGELDNVLTGDTARALLIKRTIEQYISEPGKMTALGFCAGVSHAKFMADKFNEYNYPAVALTADTPKEERRAARQKLQSGNLRIIFTVDIFNEGVDIPQVDTILLLRPTESATIFLQQLGRGLRWSPESGKRVLTVLDFVAQVRREYRYDIRYQALLGGTRSQVKQAIEMDFPLLPPGCVLKLDKIAKETVLANLQKAVQGARQRLIDDLRSLGFGTRLGKFLREANVELKEIYDKPTSGHCFTVLNEQAGFDTRINMIERNHPVRKRLGRLLHVNDSERLSLWGQVLSDKDHSTSSRLTARQKRTVNMLFAILGTGDQPTKEAEQIFDHVRNHAFIRDEVCDLLEILNDDIRNLPEPLYPDEDIPLASHATYSLAEITAAYDRTDKKGAIFMPREGVMWDPNSQTELLFVTLSKSEKDFKPSMRYDDYPISPTEFHWMSQNRTSADSPVGQRYINHRKYGTRIVLFVREARRDQSGLAHPYHCLGFANYKTHQSERPMQIIWTLERPMPQWLLQAGQAIKANNVSLGRMVSQLAS